MEQILDALQIDWVNTSHPFEEVTANVIYLSTYICFTLSKINTEVGDVYRLSMPYRTILSEHYYLLNKLACAGLRFMFVNNFIYQIDPIQTRRRINAELFPTYEFDNIQINENDDFETVVDNHVFDMMQESINLYGEGGYSNMYSDIFEFSIFFDNFDFMYTSYFSTGDRWLNIGHALLSIADISIKYNDFVLASIIMFSLNSVIKRIGNYADIHFLKFVKEFAALYTGNFTPDNLLKRWANTLLISLQSHNRIFYEI
jgi:hypothetical protein